MLWMHMGHDTRRLGRGLPGNRNILAWFSSFGFYGLITFRKALANVSVFLFVCFYLVSLHSSRLFCFPFQVMFSCLMHMTILSCYLLVNSCSGAAGKMVPEETVTTGGILRDSGSLSLLLAQSDRLFLPGRLCTSGGIPGVADPGR